jgi:hypothetical protein
VRSMRVGDDRVKAANVERLMKAFETVTFRNSESVDEFMMRVNGIVSGLRELGEKIEDSRVVWKILRVLPRKMRQVAVSIQMLCDLNTMSVEELLGGGAGQRRGGVDGSCMPATHRGAVGGAPTQGQGVCAPRWGEEWRSQQRTWRGRRRCKQHELRC